MDFFEAQDSARRKTRWMVLLFALAVFFMIAGVYLVIVGALSMAEPSPSESPERPGSALWRPEILLFVALGNLLIIGLGSLWKIVELRGGGHRVAEMLGGRKLQPNTSVPSERVVLNVVEEMALASGIPVPPVYVLDREPGINAFAAGYTPSDAVIGVNRGTIESLNRDELQGVIAHEFSHILNGDMRLNIRLIGLLNGILVLAIIGYLMLRFGGGGGRRNKGAAFILLVGLGVMVIGYIGLFFARVIKASISRQREYLADASAVQFTRDPETIGGALKMIGANAIGSRMQNKEAEQASHMFFGSMFGPGMVGLFATHPPLIDRIRRVDPGFEGDFRAYLQQRSARAVKRKADATKKPPVVAADRFLPGGFGDRFPIDPAILIATIGMPSTESIEFSQALIEQIPADLRAAARDVFSARCLVFATLLDADDSIAQSQYQMIQRNEGTPSVQETRRIEALAVRLHPSLRLPLLEIVQGALTGMSHAQYVQFRKTVDELILADRKMSLFEFVLRHLIVVHLDRHFDQTPAPRVRYKHPSQLASEIVSVLGFMARVGQEGEQAISAAFEAGIATLPGIQARMDADRFDFKELDSALSKMREASGATRKAILQAAAAVVTFDRKITVEEAELFRAIAETIDCPVPPMVAGSVGSATSG